MYYVHQTHEVKGAVVPLPTENLWLGTVSEYVADREADGWTLLANYVNQKKPEFVLHFEDDSGRKFFIILADVLAAHHAETVGLTDEW